MLVEFDTMLPDLCGVLEAQTVLELSNVFKRSLLYEIKDIIGAIWSPFETHPEKLVYLNKFFRQERVLGSCSVWMLTNFLPLECRRYRYLLM